MAGPWSLDVGIAQLGHPQVTGELLVGVLIEGAVGGAALSVLAFVLSRFTRELVGRSLLVVFLFTAAGAYFGFVSAAVPRPSPIWLLIELAHIVAFGAAALLGLRGSPSAPYWIAAGWALHPIWDAWHLLGAGSSFTPVFYPIACFGFDLVVAASIVVAYGSGLLETRGRALLDRP